MRGTSLNPVHAQAGLVPGIWDSSHAERLAICAAPKRAQTAWQRLLHASAGATNVCNSGARDLIILMPGHGTCVCIHPRASHLCSNMLGVLVCRCIAYLLVARPHVAPDAGSGAHALDRGRRNGHATATKRGAAVKYAFTSAAGPLSPKT